ncbi:hypothetical protein GCM10017674_67030 [Streptomyces gardneri]|uniref:Uncharacterized protein n=1 Tax=Streptomyces gardneri TaxID=66892 RepID=A0A4Y3RK22_9ACTN|nr:hypothetical protein SGA01_26580 [Streptomyces gardneri]GHH16755.1 hypothetical protein GCM10017674_67030 [Streptomyces gardneri]
MHHQQDTVRAQQGRNGRTDPVDHQATVGARAPGPLRASRGQPGPGSRHVGRVRHDQVETSPLRTRREIAVRDAQGQPPDHGVDVLLLPDESEDWPAEGTVADFEIWWVDSRQQIRLKPSDSRYLRNDFTDFVERVRPSWSSDIGQPVRYPGPVILDELWTTLRSDGPPAKSP